MTASTTRIAGLRYLLRLPLRAAPALCAGLLLVTVADAVGGVLVAVLVSGAVQAIAAGDPTATAQRGLAAAVVLAVTMVAHTFAFLWQAVLAERTRQVVDVQTLEAVGGRPRIDHFSSPDFLDDLQILRRDRGRIGTASMVVFQCLESGLRLTVIVVVLATVNPTLLLLPVAAVVAVWAAARADAVVQDGVQQAAAHRRRADALLATLLSAAGRQETAVYDPGRRLTAVHDAALRSATDVERAARWRGLARKTGGWLVFGVGYAVPLVALAVGWPVGRPDTAGLVLVVLLALLLFKAIADVYDAYGWLLNATATARRQLRVLGAAPAGSGPEPQPLARLADGITCRGVGFRYPSATRDALHDVDLRLPAGTVVALVGENGAGKSTLLDLILGLTTPTTGEIAVDGRPSATLPPGSLLAASTGAFQDFVRYELTLGENVGFGDPPRIGDEPALREALAAAAASALVERDPRGLATPLGEGSEAVGLSGGQWQRVAAARGHLRQAPVLRVFDEPSAALDPDAEAVLVDRIVAHGRVLAAQRGTITIVVSHRLTTARLVDLVVFLRDGAVRDVGSHDELVARCPEYAELYQIQAGAYS